MKTIKFFTLGCKVNQYDTQNIREQFLQLGLEEVKGNAPADICFINTCTVTHRSDADSLYFIRKSKRENPRAKLIVTGCFAELGRNKIRKIDKKIIFVSNKNKKSLVKSVIARHKVPKQSSHNEGISHFQGHTRAFVKIQDGCNNFCSYCRVPLARGRSESRKEKYIINEVERLVKNGFKEVVLCGVCLGSFGKELQPQTTLVSLIKKLEKITGLLRIRLSSIEAGDVTAGLIKKMANSQKLCHHLHIPIQSGDDKILKKMNRKYSRGDYLKLIKKIRAKIPDIAITTDVLVGFPAEAEDNFQNTISLIKGILPLKAHVFPYSKREGTAAADFKDEINPPVIKKRILQLEKVAQECSRDYQKQFLGKVRGVLIEARSKDNPDFWEGRTDNYIKVMIESKNSFKNQIVPAILKDVERDFIRADSY